METVVEHLPQTGEIQVTIQVSARFNYSAKAAERLVRRFVADEISYLLRVDAAVLVVAQQLCWRVPVVLAFPSTGPVGHVGTIDVSVDTGQLLITPEQISEITHHTERLAAQPSLATRPAL